MMWWAVSWSPAQQALERWVSAKLESARGARSLWRSPSAQASVVQDSELTFKGELYLSRWDHYLPYHGGPHGPDSYVGW